MPRPREFDEDKVLDKAMLQFWRHGFDGTSVCDLVEATGLGRQSLYNTFGDKHALFLAALERYHGKADTMLAPMLAKGAGVQQIRDYVDGAMAMQRSARCTGCLVVRSALELGTSDKRIQAAVNKTAKSVRIALTHALGGAIERGELPPDRTAEELAAYVFATLNGLAALVGTGGGAQQARRVVDLLFESLGKAA